MPVITDTYTMNIQVNSPLLKITNSKGHSWDRVGSNIQLAINDLGGAGEIWIPKTTDLPNGKMDVPELRIPYNGVKIHGAGTTLTKLNFTGASYGLIASGNPGSSESNWKWGVQNLQLDNFMFTGSPLQLVIRKGLLLENLYAQDITKSTAAFRITCPYGDGANGYTTSTGHYWPGSIDGMCEDIKLINCQTNRTSSHGFHFHYCVYRGCVTGNPSVQNDILLDRCIARRAGHSNTGTGGWSVGFDLAEAYVANTNQNPEETIQNFTIQNCEAYDCWESGFHFENKVRKLHVKFINCIANNNGRKYVESEPDTGEAWTYYYGAGYLHSFKSLTNNEAGDNDMTFINCTANGNGYCGYRNKYSSIASNNPVYTNCTGDDYPSGNPNGNGRGTYPHKSVGGLCLKYCTGITKIGG